MSHTRVKTKYNERGPYGSVNERTLYCHHNHCVDITLFYNEDGSIVDAVFDDEENGLWEAMNRLWSPFKDRRVLISGVEFYSVAPWEEG